MKQAVRSGSSGWLVGLVALFLLALTGNAAPFPQQAGGSSDVPKPVDVSMVARSLHRRATRASSFGPTVFCASNLRGMLFIFTKKIIGMDWLRIRSRFDCPGRS